MVSVDDDLPVSIVAERRLSLLNMVAPQIIHVVDSFTGFSITEGLTLRASIKTMENMIKGLHSSPRAGQRVLTARICRLKFIPAHLLLATLRFSILFSLFNVQYIH